MSWHFFSENFPAAATAMKNAHRAGHLAHAYLLHADSEETLTQIPIALAQLIACKDPLADGAPCEKCAACTALQNGTYTQLFKLEPVSKSRMIRVGDTAEEPGTMRWFEAQFYFTADSADSMKIGIIHDADCLNEQSQNAFLKTLEEPPPQSFILLSTLNPMKLLPTIRSRCQTLSLLKNKITYDSSFINDLNAIMHDLRFKAAGSLPEAERCAQRLTALAQTLHDNAEKKQKKLWVDAFEQIREEDWEKNERKEMQARMDAAIQAEYLGLRAEFISALHTYCAISVQLAMGLSRENLQNPEVVVEITDGKRTLNENECIAQLRCVEKLLRYLSTNVNESLALRVFALEFAFTGINSK